MIFMPFGLQIFQQFQFHDAPAGMAGPQHTSLAAQDAKATVSDLVTGVQRRSMPRVASST
jgi:hypothetical protein